MINLKERALDPLKKIDKNEEMIGKGKVCFQNGEFKKARVIFNEILEADPQNIESLFYLANIFHRNGEIGKSIKAFNRVLELDACHTDASICLSVLYNDVGKYEDAKKIFDKANERVKKGAIGGEIQDKHINKKFSLKHQEIADLYLTYNRFDESLFEYNKAIGLDLENLEARTKLAKVYAKKGFFGKAFEELRKIKNEFPEYLEARLALGILYYGNGNVLEAQSEWEKVLIKNPNHKDALMYLNLSKTATETNLRI
jgi:tetratricopeptide (TPR) repeat protein